MRLPAALALSLLALAAPAAADAAPHWSGPATAVPGTSTGGADVAVAPDGRQVLVADTGLQPVFTASGNDGRFGAPVALAPAAAKEATAPDVAIGGDGTVAVAWAVDGVVHVATAPPGGTPGAGVAVGGDGASGAAVDVGADGTVAVAWRNRTAAKQYALQVVTAPPGGGFGAPSDLEAGGSGLDSPRIDLAPDGTLAVVWRRIASGYKVRAAIRSPGGTFGPAETVSTSAAGQTDSDANVLAQPGGGALVGWSNAGGAYVRERPAGGGFGEPVALGPAGEPGFGLDLVEGAGGVGATWDAGDAIRFAFRPAGGAFGGAEQVGASSGQAVAAPRAAIDGSGRAHVIWQEPDSGAIQVAARSGGGFGATQTLAYAMMPAAGQRVAAGPADRAVAAWTAADGSVSASTFSEAAPPSVDPGPAPVKDTTKPKVRLRTTKATLDRKRRFKVRITTDEPTTLDVLSYATIAGKGRGRTHPLLPVHRKTATKAHTFTLRFGTSSYRAITKALRARKRVRVTLDVQATDKAGNGTRRVLHVTLRRR